MEAVKVKCRGQLLKTTQTRVIIMEKLEKMLAQWVQHKYQCVIPLSTTI